MIRLHYLVVLPPTILLLSSLSAQSQTFPDVPQDHWAYAAVTELHQKGILLGYPKASGSPTPTACWQSVLKAMGRRNEQALRELISDEIWNKFTSDYPRQEERLVELHKLANVLRKQEREGAAKWRPDEKTNKGTVAELFFPLYNGSSDLVLSFVQNKGGWKLANIRSIY
jgi:hypothetical protein